MVFVCFSLKGKWIHFTRQYGSKANDRSRNVDSSVLGLVLQMLGEVKKMQRRQGTASMNEARLVDRTQQHQALFTTLEQ